MIKDVFITVKGVNGLDGEQDTIELSTEGRFGIQNGQYFLSYSEGELYNSKDFVKTKVFIKSQKSVTLEREGGINSKLLIEEGKRNSCLYGTPYGDFMFGIYGEKIEFQLTESGGYIKLLYNIDSNSKLVSQNEVNITVKEV